MAGAADLFSTLTQPHSSMSYNTMVARKLTGTFARLLFNLRSACALGFPSRSTPRKLGKRDPSTGRSAHAAVMASKMMVLLAPASKAKNPQSSFSGFQTWAGQPGSSAETALAPPASQLKVWLQK